MPVPRPTAGARRILRDISSLAVASVLVKPLWLGFLIVLCPRVLGVAGYGTFTVALAVVSVALAFTDLGMSAHTVREVAAQRGLASRYFSNFVPLRFGITTLAVGIAVAVVIASGYTPVAVAAVAAAGAYRVTEAVAVYGRAYYRSAEAFQADARAIVAEKVLVVVAGGAALLWFGSPAYTLAGMAAGSALFAAGVLWHVASRLAPFRPRLWSRPFVQRSLWQMAPLGLIDLFTTLYLRVDQVMIDAFLGASSAGVYALAYRVLEALTIIPSIVVQSVLFPKMARAVRSGDGDTVRRLMTSGALGLLAISAAVVGAGVAAGPWALALVVDDPAFAASGGLFQLLVWTFPLTCLSNLFFFYLVARSSLRHPMVALGGAALLNVGLNAVALPRFGVEGAVVATICAEALVVAVYLASADVRDAFRGRLDDAPTGRPPATDA